MKLNALLMLSAVIVVVAVPAVAQDEPAVTTTQLAEHIYQLTTDQGAYTTTTLASVGPDGLLLVDGLQAPADFSDQ